MTSCQKESVDSYCDIAQNRAMATLGFFERPRNVLLIRGAVWVIFLLYMIDQRVSHSQLMANAPTSIHEIGISTTELFWIVSAFLIVFGIDQILMLGLREFQTRRAIPAAPEETAPRNRPS